MTMVTDLKVGEVLSRAFSTWMDHFGGFFVLALALTFPAFLIELLPVVGITDEGTGTGMFANYVQTAMRYLLIGIVVFTVFHSLYDDTPDGAVMDSIQEVKSQIGWLVGAAILLPIIFFIGFLLCIVPGVILMLMFVVVVPVIAVEQTNLFDAFKRSKELTDGFKVQILLVYLVYGLILFGVAIVAGIGVGFVTVAIGGDDPGTGLLFVGALLSYGMEAVIIPLQATITAVIYHDLRMIQDGVDFEEMFPSQSGGGQPGGGQPIGDSQPGGQAGAGDLEDW